MPGNLTSHLWECELVNGSCVKLLTLWTCFYGSKRKLKQNTVGIFNNLLNFYMPHSSQHCDGNNTNIYETRSLSEQKEIYKADRFLIVGQNVVYIIKYFNYWSMVLLFIYRRGSQKSRHICAFFHPNSSFSFYEIEVSRTSILGKLIEQLVEGKQLSWSSVYELVSWDLIGWTFWIDRFVSVLDYSIEK